MEDGLIGIKKNHDSESASVTGQMSLRGSLFFFVVLDQVLAYAYIVKTGRLDLIHDFVSATRR